MPPAQATPPPVEQAKATPPATAAVPPVEPAKPRLRRKRPIPVALFFGWSACQPCCSSACSPIANYAAVNESVTDFSAKAPLPFALTAALPGGGEFNPKGK